MEQSILTWSLRGLLMAVGTGLVVSTLRVRAASALHRAWAATMVSMLVLPVWTKWGPSVIAPVLPAEQAKAAITVFASASGLAAGMHASDPAAPSESPQAGLAEPLPSAPRGLRPNWRAILLALYLAGFAAMLGRLIWGTLLALSTLRGARPAEGFFTSPCCAVPVTIGWLRPVLLLPEDWPTWPATRLEAVLIHEREHARRRDPLVQWLALFNRCIFWFHPLAWWLERKLAALAEDACDGAVLARGYEAHDYARHLIELAQSVSEMGGRFRWSGTVAFSAGSLPRRIRRIVDAQPAAAISSAQSAVSAGLCVLLLSACLACNLGHHSNPTSNRISMSQQQRQKMVSALDRQRKSQQEEALLEDAVLGLTPARAKIREAELRKYPGDEYKARELVRYYEFNKDWKALDALTLWFIAEHPDIREGWGTRPVWDKIWDSEGYQRARKLWMEQLNQPGHGPYFYMNAGEYLSGSDNDKAEQLLLEGKRRFPSAALHWEVLLARHYAWALAGTAGQLPEGPIVIGNGESAASPPGPYAQKIREKLLVSNDTELLDRTVEQLQFSKAGAEFAQSLIDRVLSLDPGNRMAHLRREYFSESAIFLRAKTNPGGLSESERIVFLVSQLGHPREVQDREAKANELLALAPHNHNDPNYGTAIFLANLQLGEAALNRGDKPGAVRHLLAAAEAPPTEFLRYNQINMALPRKLFDSGERRTVATFLDRCSKFNQGGVPLAQWATQIRKGNNPRLFPDFDQFSEAR
jgi:hypothetical protein